MSRLEQACGQCKLIHQEPKKKGNVKFFNINTEKSSKNAIIEKHHSLLGHIDVTKLVNFLRDANFNWAGLNNDVVEFCKGYMNVLNEKTILGEPIHHTQSLLTNLLKK